MSATDADLAFIDPRTSFDFDAPPGAHAARMLLEKKQRATAGFAPKGAAVSPSVPASPEARIGRSGAAGVIEVDHRRLRRHGVFFEAQDQPSKLAIGAYKQLRTQVLAQLRELGARSLMVTGPTAGVGKTTVALNLALNIARLEYKHVLVVDLDLRASSMLDVLGLKRKHGSERLAEPDFSLAQASVPLGPRLRVLPCADRREDSSECLVSKSALSFFDTMSRLPEDFVVIYDTAPVLGCDDVPAVLPVMEAAILVVEEGRTGRAELREAQRRLGSVPLVATVLNKSRDRDIRRHYY